MVVQRNLLEKAYFIAKMFSQAMIQPASSDFWKAPKSDHARFDLTWYLLKAQRCWRLSTAVNVAHTS